MGKKKHKSRNSILNDSTSLLSLSDGDLSFPSLNSTNVSINTGDTLPDKFVVASVHSANCTTYAKCLKTDFESIIFIHPLIMRSYEIEDLVLVQGEQNKELCVAHSLKNLKKSLVVFPKSNCGFKNHEVVSLQPFERCKVKCAEEVLISPSETNEDISQNVKDYILRLLCNKYVYIGIHVKYKLFDREYLCYVKNITSSLDLADLSLKETSDSEYSKFYTVSHKTVLKFESKSLQSEDKVSFYNIGGLEKQIMCIKQHMQMFFGTGCYPDSVFCGTLILQGPSGTGKSLLLRAITEEYDVLVLHIWWYNLYTMSQSEVKQELESVFQKAIDRVPSVIIIDDFNYLCPDKTEAENLHLYVSKLLSQLVSALDDSRVMIIVATNVPDFDKSILKAARRLMDIIKIKIPSQLERADILLKLLNARKHDLSDDQIQECASLAHGFTGKDLLDALKDAETLSCKRKYSNITETSELFNIIRIKDSGVGPILCSDLKLTVKLKKPAIVSANDLQVKKVQWSDIGGMTDVKEKLKQLVEWPLKYPEAFKHFNITPSRGVLMYGPPGCSKTMIAKALATECELNFISKNASDLFDKYVGESEKAVRDLFAMAKAKAPCIIFLDEIDALVIERGSSSTSSGVGDRIVTTLLTEMDGIEELHGVIIIAATNRPDMLDDALVRNGRINNFIYVPLPDAATRKEIIKINMRNRYMSEDFDYKLLSEKTEGYSGAEIVNICNEAALQLLSEDPKAESPTFNMSHFEEALQQVLPRTRKEMITFYERFNNKHCTKS